MQLYTLITTQHAEIVQVVRFYMNTVPEMLSSLVRILE